MKKYLPIVLIILSLAAKAKEGMWIPMLLNNNIAEMQAMGCELSAEEIYSINQSSLKDAIVSFGGFCTGEFISSKGLVLTNHHCGYGQIQKHSSIENNYLKDGFWANSMAEELKNPGLFVEQLVYMEEVTNEVFGTADAESAAAALLAQKEAEDPALLYEIVPFFGGNRYFLLATVKFKDVRLVGAPPSSIGKFGADTDNWVFPRHTGDFSLFRVYDEQGQPYAPARHLTINIAPRTEGEFTMVFGYPGRTQEYLTALELDHLVNVQNARFVEIREAILGIMDKYMRADEQVKLHYASKYASLANAWKKWKGQIEGIEYSNGIDRKRRLEAEFTARIANDPVLWEKYSALLGTLTTHHVKTADKQLDRNEFLEYFYYGLEWSNFVMRYGNNGKSQEQIAQFAQNFDRKVSEEISLKVLEMAFERFPELEQFMDGGVHEFVSTVHDELDQLFQANEQGGASLELLPAADHFVTEAYNYWRTELTPDPDDAQLSSIYYGTYLKALQEAFPERAFYADANSTLRVTYGKLEGVSPRDAVSYRTTTYLDGVIAKYQPGDYEFDVPQKLLDLYDRKDFGPYAENGKVPVCNIASNHTTGWNSGSPVLNGRGELIGLNFDRIWEGTMSDVNFDAEICRNIMVDSRYVLFIIDKFAGQTWLIEEMTLNEG